MMIKMIVIVALPLLLPGRLLRGSLSLSIYLLSLSFSLSLYIYIYTHIYVYIIYLSIHLSIYVRPLRVSNAEGRSLPRCWSCRMMLTLNSLTAIHLYFILICISYFSLNIP